jgi:small subunit ribosomal protein S16
MPKIGPHPFADIGLFYTFSRLLRASGGIHLAVTIRLTRQGHRHRPFYRITVADSRRSPKGKFLEQIGYYDPTLNPPTVKIDEAGVLRWMQNGAKPSDTVRALLHRQGILEKEQLVSKGKAVETVALKVRAWEKKKTKVHKKAKVATPTATPAAPAAAPAEPAPAA